MTDAMTTAITTAFNGVKTDVVSLMTSALPVGLTIMGIGLAITLGIKFFKKVSSKA